MVYTQTNGEIIYETTTLGFYCKIACETFVDIAYINGRCFSKLGRYSRI